MMIIKLLLPGGMQGKTRDLHFLDTKMMKLKTLNQLTVLETLLFSYPQMIFGLYQEARDI